MNNALRPKLASFLKARKADLVLAWHKALIDNNLLEEKRAKTDGQYYEMNVIAPIDAFLEAVENDDLSAAYRVIDTNIALRGLDYIEVSAVIRRVLLMKRLVREFIYRYMTKMRRSNFFVFIGEIMDKYIHEVVQHYEQLQKSQTAHLNHYYQGIIENTLAGIMVADKDGVIQTVNPMMAKIANRERDKLIGQIVHKDVLRHADEELREAHARALEGEATTFEEKKYMRNNAKIFLDILVGPLRDPNNEIIGTVHVVIDATEKVNLGQVAARRKQALHERLNDLQDAYGYIGKINRQLSSLIEIGDVMSSQQSLKDTLEYIVRSAAMVTKASGVALDLKSLQAGPERSKANYKHSEYWIYPRDPRAIDINRAPEHGIDRRIVFIDMKQQDTFNVETSSERWMEVVRQWKPPLSLLVVVPIAFQDECVGSLTLYFRDPKEFSTLESNLLIAMANQAAVALNVSTLAKLQNL